MRLIVADALIVDAIKERRFVFQMKDCLNPEFVVRTVYNDLADFIAAQPTIEAEPVKRGRWERLNYVAGWARCSNCESPWELSKIDAFNMDYCPNCGAKMEREDE